MKYSGKDGQVTFGSSDTLRVTEWSISVDRDVIEGDEMGQDFKDAAPGHHSWTATVNCYLDDTTNIDPTDEATKALTITAKTGVEYSGDAFLTNASLGAPVNGWATVNYSFRGAGTLTHPGSAA